MKQILLLVVVLTIGIAIGVVLRPADAQSRTASPTVSDSAATGKHLTAQQWRALVTDDPVLQLHERISEKAPKHPEWNTCYPCAFYKVYGEEYRKYVSEKYSVSSYGVDLTK